MSIFQEYTGKSTYFTANEQDRLENPEKYNYSQADYDAFSAQAMKKADSRNTADLAAQDAIKYGYTGRGTGETQPAFSFGGYGGHTSGGTAGNVNLGGLAGIFGGGSTTETTGVNQDDPEQAPDNEGPRAGKRLPTGRGSTQHKANGGVIYPVQHMEAGGMIQSPYANPMKQQMGMFDAKTMEQPLPQMSRGTEMGGVGGMFQNMQQQFGQKMNQMQSSPLNVYSNYLNQTYVGPQSQEMQSKVEEFVDLVDQAERAHFGAEESFGYGGGPMEQQFQQQIPNPMSQMPGPQDMGIGSLQMTFQ